MELHAEQVGVSSIPPVLGNSQKPNLIPCPYCREPVNSLARKCIKCGSDIKGWRSYVSVGTSTLALMTALIAVIGAFTPVILRVFGPHDAVIHTTYVSTVHADNGDNNNGFDSVELLVSNDGTKSGAVMDGQIHIAWEVSGNSYGLSLYFSKKWHEPTILDPGKSAALTMQLAPQIIPDQGTDDANIKVLLNDLAANPSSPTNSPLEIRLNSTKNDIETCSVTLNAVYNSGVPASLPAVPANCSDFNPNIVPAGT